MPHENLTYEELQKEIMILRKTIEVQRTTINRLLDTYVLETETGHVGETSPEDIKA